MTASRCSGCQCINGFHGPVVRSELIILGHAAAKRSSMLSSSASSVNEAAAGLLTAEASEKVRGTRTVSCSRALRTVTLENGRPVDRPGSVPTWLAIVIDGVGLGS